MASVTSLRLAIRNRISKQASKALKKKAAFETTKVYICFSLNGQMQYVPTGEIIETETWDAKAGRVLTPPRLSAEESKKRQATNDKLAATLDKARAVFVEAERNGIAITAEYLKNAIAPKPIETDSEAELFAYLSQWHTIAEDKQVKLKRATLISNIKAYTPTLKVADLSVMWLEGFAGWLQKEQQNKPTTIRKKIDMLTTGLKKAPFVDRLPRLEVKIKGGNAYEEKARLDTSELRALIALTPKVGTIKWYALQLFKLGVYSGFRPTDLLNLTPANLQNREHYDEALGKYVSIPVLAKVASKTSLERKTEKVTPAIGPIVEILNQLAPLSPFAQYFPQGKGRNITSRDADPILSQMRRAIKELAAEAGITKEINNYTARHTGAELIYTRTNNLRSVSTHIGSSTKVAEKHYTNKSNLAQAFRDSEAAFAN